MPRALGLGRGQLASCPAPVTQRVVAHRLVHRPGAHSPASSRQAPSERGALSPPPHALAPRGRRLRWLPIPPLLLPPLAAIRAVEPAQGAIARPPPDGGPRQPTVRRLDGAARDAIAVRAVSRWKVKRQLLLVDKRPDPYMTTCHY